jgi:hypothetical protein
MKTMLLAGIAALSVLSRHLSCTVNTPGIVLEPDQHGGRSCARSQLFGWCWMGVRCDPPGGGTFQFRGEVSFGFCLPST